MQSRLGWSLVALLSLAACQSVRPLPLLPTSKPEQTLRVAVASLPASTDPALTPPYDSGFARTGFEALLKPKPDLSDVQPAGAASYDVSPDGLTYTFHLQPRGTWSDGIPVRAADFVLGWRRVLDPRVNSPVADLLARRVKGAGAYDDLDPKNDATRIPAFLDGLGLRAADDHTFLVTLDHLSLDFKWVAAVPALAPARGQPAAGPAPGNGPFHLESSTRQQLVLAANPFYWDGRPKLDRIVLSLQGGGAPDLDRYRSGGEDLTTLDAARGAVAAKDPALAQQLVRVPRLAEVWMQFNVHQPPFDSAAVRLAFAEAIDRQALVAQLDQPALPSVGPVPKGLADYRAGLAAQAFSAEAARATLNSTGSGPEALGTVHLLVRDLPADKALAQFIATQVKNNLGVEVALDVKASLEVTSTLQTGHFQFQAPAGWLADYPDERTFLDLFRTEDFDQWSRYSSPGYDRLVAEADAAAEPAQRLQRYAQAQQLLVEDAPAAFLYQPLSLNLKQDWVEGVTYTPLDDWPGDLYANQITITQH